MDKDGDIILVETMRTMLADLPSTITQYRIDNIQDNGSPRTCTSSVRVDYETIVYGRSEKDSTEESLSSAPEARVRLPRCNGANPASCPSPKPTKHLQKSRRSVPGKEEPKFSSKVQEFERSVEQTTSSPVGGRLSMFRAAWAKLTDDQLVTNIVEKRFVIPFRNIIPNKKVQRKENLLKSFPNEKAEAQPTHRHSVRDLWKFYTRWSAPAPTATGHPLTLRPHRFKRKMIREASEAITREVTALLSGRTIEEMKVRTPRVLQKTLHDPKEYRRPPPSIGSPGAQQPCVGALLQDGDPDIRIQDDQEEGLHGVPRIGRRLHACSNPPDVQEIPEVFMDRSDIPIPHPSFRSIFKP
ncbi:hypothetical protein AYI69_g10834 [Smittium culicis]|uniref:Uncharacterized protein n=1 Tax=Smittium culicis TaxID=133412 RepID=A0A1R1X359_9FUNG|nr:hypothetical protein AYI69_g10834 [Smittium culicis]